MADYYLHKTAAHIDELLEKVEGLNNYDDTEVRGLINNKVDKVTGKGLSTNDFTDAYKETLDGLDAALDSKVDKETGKGLSTNDFTNAYKTELDGLDTALDGKVDKETGKGLSTNDYTTSEKTKLNGVESGANVNVQADWNQTDTTADDYIRNKPNIPSGVVVDQVYDGTSTNAQSGVAIAGALSDKVDKVTGKGLSTNDYTTAEKDKLAGIASGAEVNVQSDWSQSDSTAEDYIKNKPSISTVNDATLTIQKNGTAVGTFSANAATAATINITVPVDAADVSALPDTTKYGASLALNIDSSTYVVTAVLKDQDGNTLGTAQTIDLPLETVVVGGSYDDTTKKVILTLKNGSTIDFSVADLVAGLQTEITSTNKLDADLVDDTTSAHKFVTASDKATWNAKSDFSGDYDDLTNKPTIPTVDQTYNSASTNAQSGVAIEGKKPGLKTTGTEYTISGQTVTAGEGAEVFNDLVTNKASGQYSHAEGFVAFAYGNYSHAEGNYTTASSDCQHVQGKYNVIDANSTYAFIIGNGKGVMSRHNAFAVDWNGLIYVNGATTGVDVAALAATIGDINTVLEEVL